MTAVNNEIPGTHRHPAVTPSRPSEVARKLGALGAHLSAATAATVTLAVVLSGCSSYGPLGKDDLKTSWTAIGGSADREVSGPDGILHEIKDNTVYAPSTCSILAGPDVASPYALDDLGSSDPGFSGNFNSPSRPSPSPGSIPPPGLSDYLGGTRLFATEQKATDYFNAVAGALNTCHSVETTYKGSASRVTWVKEPYATQGTITWSVGKVTGLLIRKGNIVLVAHSVSSNVPDIAVDAAKLSQAMGAS